MTDSGPTRSQERTPTHELAHLLAAELRRAHTDVVRRWLDRIVARVRLDQNAVFPTDELLDHVPLLVDGIADYIESNGSSLDNHVPVEAKAMELGALRHAQGFDAYQILKEHEILAGILFTFLGEALERVAPEKVQSADVAHVWRRVAEAIDEVRQATMTHFLRVSAEQVRQREERLRGFNRMVSHELKNRVGAIHGAHSLLTEPWVDETQRAKFLAMIGENAEGIRALLDNLVTLSRMDSDGRQSRHIELPRAAAEATRQLREFARARGVTVHLAEDLPTVEINAPAVELCLSNYISNAIKYSDPAKTDRWVLVEAEVRTDPESAEPSEIEVRVRDNGLGIPEDAAPKLFQRFYRAHEQTAAAVDGTGLGLSIVRETVEGLGGRAWAERNDDGGSTFAFALPSRRSSDIASAETSEAAAASS